MELTTCLPSGGYCLLGLNSSLSSPTSEQVCYKGGGNVGISPGNRALVSDHRPTGFLKVNLGQREFSYHFMSSLVPSNLPSDQAVVIQQLSIG